VLGAMSLLALPVAAAPQELLVVGAHFARVYERSPAGEFIGMGPEILRSIADQLVLPLRFELYPWARAQSMVAQGQADILVGPYKSAERLEQFFFSERPFYQDNMVFYARAGSAFDWDGNYAALREKRIVTINGWAYGDEFDAARKGLAISVTNAVDTALTMLMHGRVELFATNVRNTAPVIASLGFEGMVVPLERIIAVQRGYFAFPKRPEHEPARLRFDRALNGFIDAGGLRRLGSKLSVHVP
jgi:polar amino acid transport system substrate-binding protein